MKKVLKRLAGAVVVYGVFTLVGVAALAAIGAPSMGWHTVAAVLKGEAVITAVLAAILAAGRMLIIGLDLLVEGRIVR